MFRVKFLVLALSVLTMSTSAVANTPQFQHSFTDSIHWLNWVTRPGQSNTSEVRTRFEGISLEDLEALKNRVQIEWTLDTLTLETPQGVRVVDAINEPRLRKITVNMTAWDALAGQQDRRMALALHEYLGIYLYHQDQTSLTDQDYQLSGPFLRSLEGQLNQQAIAQTIDSQLSQVIEHHIRYNQQTIDLLQQQLEILQQSDLYQSCVNGRRKRSQASCYSAMALFLSSIEAVLQRDHARTSEQARGHRISMGFALYGLKHDILRFRPRLFRRVREQIEQLDRQYQASIDRIEHQEHTSTNVFILTENYLNALPRVLNDPIWEIYMSHGRVLENETRELMSQWRETMTQLDRNCPGQLREALVCTIDGFATLRLDLDGLLNQQIAIWSRFRAGIGNDLRN